MVKPSETKPRQEPNTKWKNCIERKYRRMYHQNRNKRERKSSEPGSNKNLDIRSRSG
jgi:hypothetical protein